VVSKGNAKNYEYALRVQPNGAAELILWAPGGSTYQTVATAPGTITTGASIHLVGTCQNGISCNIYVNGKQQASVTSGWGATLPGAGAASVTIGRRADGVQPLTGVIDDVAIYSTALTATQVEGHFSAGR
jgi:hypothetical protein